MARIGLQKRITIDLGLGAENPVLIVRRPTPQEHAEFLDARFERRDAIALAGARVEFIKAILTGCEHVEIETAPDAWVALTPDLPNWKDQVPVHWLTSAAIEFEERERKDHEKNSARPSSSPA